ncbi:MAG: hypothetical protein A2148_04125 [Chloroflexi bacterium RBG_16_68_14]|nr:MAG: hypothetical protein A2148_04125 [Chloroflexi bacterium RBG_16_68_14]
MRVRRWLLLASLPLLVTALLLVACGGSGDDAGPPDLSKIPTATPPDPLPEVVIVGAVSPVLQGETYVVQAGDSPASIAAQFGVTAEAIMEANGITDPTKLEVGQVLTISGVPAEESAVLDATREPKATPTPAPAPEEQTTYIVQEGDIPESIAAQFGISTEELMAANGITDPTSLDIGQELIIPARSATPEP